VVGAQGAAGELSLRVRVAYFRQDESIVVLREARIPVDADGGTRAMSVDILPCLRDSLRVRTASPEQGSEQQAVPSALRCDVFVELALLEDGVLRDETGAGPFGLTPGGRTEIQAPPLFRGANTPAVTAASGATAVDLGLIRLAAQATDPDGNLSSVQLLHTAGTQTAFATVDLPTPTGELADTLYWFISMGSTNLGSVRLDVYDTKSASATLTLPVLRPDAARPIATNVSVSAGLQTTTVSFTLFDRDSDGDTVEVLFRTPSSTDAQFPVLGGLAGPPCVRAVQPGNANGAARQVTCPTPGQSFAQVVVIPFDRAGPGQAARGSAVVP
jgi:hypothetical protein